MIPPDMQAVIDRWVAEQMARPWPLTSSQLDLVRRALAPRPTQAADGALPPTAA